MPPRVDRLLRSAAPGAPWIVLAAGAAFTAYLLTLPRPGVFYSGDAGLKSLLVEQFARGDLHPDLRLEGAPWVEELWTEGAYPFQPPFVYAEGERRFAAFPLPFLYLTAPATAALGWRGLYLWPALGVVAVWLALIRLCNRLGLGPTWTAVALLAVVASPLTIYAAMFWEHTPGVALAFGGLGLLAAPAPRSERWNGLVAGLLVGAAVWFRSELVWLAAVATALLPVAPRLGVPLRGRVAFVAGVAAAGALLLGWNVLAYGSPLGMHARQVVEGADLAGRAREIAWVIPRLLRNLAAHGPVVLLAALAAAAALATRRGQDGAPGQVRFWAGLGLAFLVGVAIVLPRLASGADGGKQFGPRYLLVLFPVAAVVLAVSAKALFDAAATPWRVAIALAVGIAVGASVRVNLIAGARDLADDYAHRVAPILDAVRADPARVLVASDQYVSQELASQLGAKQVLLAGSAPELARLLPALWAHGEGRFLFGTVEQPLEGDLRVAAPGATASTPLRFRVVGCTTQFCLHEVRLLSPPPTSAR
jgi:hypothetical protein